MITIQGFAKLCGCNTQTLRYYDRIGLLTPARVDEWTGYRYYEEKQALLFVKIKNLQQADFSIDEIRPLLEADSVRLQEAFERKIAEQKQRLERIKKRQNTYLKENMEMQKTLCMLTDLVEGRSNDPKLWEEFGLDASQETEANAKVHELVADWLMQIRNASEEIARQMNVSDLDAMKAVMDKLSEKSQDGKGLILSIDGEGNENGEEIPEDAVKVFERSGWEHVSEWIDSLPELESVKKHFFRFSIREDSPVGDPGFPFMMLAVMAARYDFLQDGIFCKVGLSDDGLNHFALLQK